MYQYIQRATRNYNDPNKSSTKNRVHGLKKKHIIVK